jgi:hypothetical protein
VLLRAVQRLVGADLFEVDRKDALAGPLHGRDPQHPREGGHALAQLEGEAGAATDDVDRRHGQHIVEQLLPRRGYGVQHAAETVLLVHLHASLARGDELALAAAPAVGCHVALAEDALVGLERVAELAHDGQLPTLLLEHARD